ncbi:hypothetical protein GRZ55_11410 [Chelativorans sp. ZYF759]|nr:hypothetical protein [Chelativorans sp. ZYF759]NMG39852.1 hypothetical protein [Chelativorans sp. ZYF759]
MELLLFIGAASLAGGILAFLLLRRSKHTRRRKPRGRHDFLENPNEWGW